MAHENVDDAKMALDNIDDEIDQYLVGKIRDAINLAGKPKNFVAKSYSFKTEFTKLVNHLSSKNAIPESKVKEEDWMGVRRGNLYTLNNLVIEWQQICKNQTSFTGKELYDACENIKKNLSKVNKDVYGDQESSSSEGSHSHHKQIDNNEIFSRHTKDVYRWSSRHEPRKVHGIEHRVLAMVRELVMRNTEAPFKVFGVVGVSGIGKTTLCQCIFGNKFVKEHFSPRIWVCLSKQPRDRSDYREEIVVRMLKCLGIEDELIDNAANGGLKKLILFLRLQLIGTRYLIVLDDAWKEDNFFYNLTEKDRLDENWGEELAYGLPKGCGGTVLSSSTSETLLKEMLGKDVSLQHLEPLHRDIIYEIFKDAVIGYDDDEREYHKDLELIEKVLLDRCDGIPLAAKLLAKIAWKKLEIMPKSLKPQQTPTGGERSRDIGHALAGGHEELVGGDSGVHDQEIGDDQMA